MKEATSNKHYEEKFEFTLWKMIKQRANEKDISYMAASEEVVPEYVASLHYRDEEFNDKNIYAWMDHLEEMKKKAAEENK